MARDPRREGCGPESRARGEPMVGTASRVRRWLIIEQPGPWGRDALHESYIPAAVAARIDANARAHGVRVLLARQLGADRAAPRRVFLARTDRVHRWIEQLEVPDVEEVTSLDLSALGADGPPGVGAPVPASLALVCTNGRHDPCCADLGRPVVRALRDAGVDVWESSHVGGDRFAANLVSLPSGVYYGRVEPGEAATLLADLDRGVLDLDRYRGRSAYPPAMQAAEIFARRHLGERRLPLLRFAGAEQDGSRTTAVLTHADGREVTVTVAREPGPPAALTCAGPQESRPWHHRLVSLVVTPA